MYAAHVSLKYTTNSASDCNGPDAAVLFPQRTNAHRIPMMDWGTLPESMILHKEIIFANKAMPGYPVALHTRSLKCCGDSSSMPPAEPFLKQSMALRTSPALVLEDRCQVQNYE